MPSSAPAQFLRVVLKLIAIGFAALFMGFLLTPAAWQGRKTSPDYVSEVLSAEAIAPQPDEAPTVKPTPLLPRATTTLDVHIGPSVNYIVIGTLPRGARLDIVGRDASLQWLAIVFNDGSKLTGWIPNQQVENIPDVSALPLAPVTFLPAR